MSLIYSPKILSSGIVLALDAADPNSYPGTGTAWYDLSGNSNTATMFGSLPFVDDASGCFDFSTVTGVSSGAATLGFTFASNMIPTTGNFSLSCWVKNPPATVGQSGFFSNAAGGDGYRFGVGRDGIYWLIGPDYSEFNALFQSPLNTTSWYNITTVWARAEGTPQLRLYLNGVFQSSANFMATQTAFTNTAPGMVRSPCCMPLFDGKLAQFMAYNKVITNAEIIQNFNALKSRFGV